MSNITDIQWADTTVNPIMGCGGCELFPPPGKVLAAIDTAVAATDTRIEENTLETISTDANGGQLFRYTFHDPGDPNGLGNDRETIIGPGDSGGPALVEWGDGYAIVGINTFGEGFGGRFGDIGGGVLLDQGSVDWILETTGIPEPGVWSLVVLSALLALRRGRMYRS